MPPDSGNACAGPRQQASASTRAMSAEIVTPET
jgi:hypothetical protein